MLIGHCSVAHITLFRMLRTTNAIVHIKPNKKQYFLLFPTLILAIYPQERQNLVISRYNGFFSHQCLNREILP